jgi:O-antigen/teichoic acid export membrane protein
MILILTTTGNLDLTDWAVTCATLSMIICVITIWYGARGSGGLRLELRESFTQLRTGMLFAVGLSAQTVYNEIDKVMLSRLSSADNAAIYAAAYRVVDFAYVPMRAMAGVAYPKFFEKGKHGTRAAFQLTRSLAPKYLLYTVPVSLLLVAFAWTMPHLFGQEFAAAEFALQGLAALLVLKALHYLAADTLSGSRLQTVRSTAQVAVAVANASLCLWLIPTYGWQGAVVASLACDALLAVLLWTALLAALRRSPEPPSVDSENTLRQSTNA